MTYSPAMHAALDADKMPPRRMWACEVSLDREFEEGLQLAHKEQFGMLSIYTKDVLR